MKNTFSNAYEKMLGLLNGFIAVPDLALENKRQRLILGLFLMIGIVVCYSFAIFHFRTGNHVGMTILLAVGTIQAASISLLRYSKKVLPVFWANAIILALYFLYMLITGGVRGSAIFWLFLFPPFSFFLLGKKEGLLCNLVVYVLFAVVMLDPYGLVRTFPYDPAVKIRFLVAYFAMGLMTYIVESARQWYQKGMDSEQVKLRLEVERRKNIEDQLRRYQNQLESMVNKRTVELTESNYQLQKEIARRLKIDEALREREEKYRTLVNNINVGIYRTTGDASGKCLEANPAIAAMLGYGSVEEFMAVPVSRHYKDARQRREFLEELRQKGAVANRELSLQRKDGTEILASCTATVKYDAEGKIEWIDGALHDITKRKKAEQAIQESEKRYRELFNSISDIIYTHDLQGRFISVNRATAETIGYGMDELVGMPIGDLMKPKFRESFYSQYLTEVKREGHSEGISIYLGRDGAEHFVEYRSILVQRENQEPYVSGSGREVTDRVLAEREMRQLEEQLMQSQKMEAMGTLAGGVAHEFNNILMGIGGYTQLLAAKKGLDPEVADYLKRIEESNKRAANLTNTMLNFSRRETGDKVPVDMNQVVEGVRSLLGQTLPVKVQVELDLSPELPLLMANPNQLEQVLLNLAVNACDAMPQGGNITIATRQRSLDQGACAGQLESSSSSYLELAVSDTGQGMSLEVLDRVFEPFFTTKEPGKGTGLGLSVVYSVIENHGGKIKASSSPGQGSTFRICLPIAAGVVAPEEGSDDAEPLPRGAGEAILVVDDEYTVREIAREALESFGYRVKEAADGQEALNLYQRASDKGQPFDLVFLDIAMPVMDGRECFARLREIDPVIKIVITTGYTDNQLGIGELEKQASGMLRKPFDLSRLIRETGRVLSDKPGKN